MDEAVARAKETFLSPSPAPFMLSATKQIQLYL